MTWPEAVFGGFAAIAAAAAIWAFAWMVDRLENGR
jgi:hypothetical protein